MPRIPAPLVGMLGSTVATAGLLILRLTGRRLGVVLVYHAVEQEAGDPARQISAPHGARQLAGHLRHLKACYRVVEAGDILAAASARRRGGRFPVAVTFDDDLASHARLAVPILQRLGVPASFFLCGASLHGPFEFWWERLQRSFDDGRSARGATIHAEAERLKRLSASAREEALAELDPGPPPHDAGMRAHDVHELVEAHMTIGFHTRLHEPLTQLDAAGLAEAMHAGREELEAVTGTALHAIAYPHGAKDERVLAAARAAGFTLGFSTAGDPVRPRDDPLAIPRIVPTHRSTGHFALQLLTQLLEG